MFEVKLPFGSFPYIQVRNLDTAWSLMVGKGLQVVVAWIFYKIFALELLWIMERSKMSFDLYTATALYPTDVLTMWRLLRGLAAGRLARESAVFVWFCVAAAYAIVISTVLDPATGYSAPQEAAVNTRDGSFTPFEQLRWYDGNGTQFTECYEVHGDLDCADTYALTSSVKNFTYSELVDGSTFR